MKFNTPKAALKVIRHSLMGNSLLHDSQASIVARKLIADLDAAGFAVLPHQPTAEMLASASRAMREVGYIQGSPSAVNEQKQTARYKAMIEAHRHACGLARGGEPDMEAKDMADGPD